MFMLFRLIGSYSLIADSRYTLVVTLEFMKTHDCDHSLNDNDDGNTDRLTCDAEDCKANAVKKIKIPAGRFGLCDTLRLC